MRPLSLGDQVSSLVCVSALLIFSSANTIWFAIWIRFRIRIRIPFFWFWFRVDYYASHFINNKPILYLLALSQAQSLKATHIAHTLGRNPQRCTAGAETRGDGSLFMSRSRCSNVSAAGAMVFAGVAFGAGRDAQAILDATSILNYEFSFRSMCHFSALHMVRNGLLLAVCHHPFSRSKSIYSRPSLVVTFSG